MNEIYQQILVVLYGIWLRRWYAIAVTWLVCMVGWVAVATIPDKYSSSARIYVDTDTMLRPLMRDIAVNFNIIGQVRMMERTLLSRPNLEKVARMTDLDLTAQTSLEMENLIESLKRDISISASGGDLYSVSYVNENPKVAKDVVQALLTIFVEGNLGDKRSDLADARRFIESQLRDYERQLEEAEKRRTDFRRQNMGMLPQDGQNYYERLQKVTSEYEKAKDDLEQTRYTYETLSTRLESIPQYIETNAPFGPPGSGGANSNQPGGHILSRIREMERQLDGLLLRYTEQHPDVIAMRRSMAALQDEFKREQDAFYNSEEVEEGSGVPGGGAIVPNPVYEQSLIRLIDLEQTIASLEGKEQRLKGEIEELNRVANSALVVENEMSKLNRDYGVIKSKYESLLVKREEARISQDIETKSDNVQYRIIDPPEVPLKPSSPNRPLFLFMVLVMGIGVGGGAAFLLSQLHTTYISTQKLRETFALPVLGTVTAVLSPVERRRNRLELSTFAMTCVGLLVAFGIVMAWFLTRQTGVA